MTNNCSIITCPPLADYKLQPADHSASTTMDCPRCKNKMWISVKKKSVIKMAKNAGHTIILVCYHCIEQVLKEMKDNGIFKTGDEIIKSNL